MLRSAGYELVAQRPLQWMRVARRSRSLGASRPSAVQQACQSRNYFISLKANPDALSEQIAHNAVRARRKLDEKLRTGALKWTDLKPLLTLIDRHAYTLPFSVARENYGRLQLGSRLLDWLKEHMSEWEDIDDNAVLNVTCLLLRLEDKDEMAWEWVTQHPVPSESQSLFKDVNKLWQQRIVMGLIKTYAEIDPSGTADAALRALRRADDLRRESHHACLDLYQPGNKIMARLMTATIKPGNPHLFESFLRDISKWRKPASAVGFDARLRLFHPTDADAKPFLKRYREGNPYVNVSPGSPGLPPRATAVVYNVLRASYILELREDTDGASELNGDVATRRPEIWEDREYYWEGCDKDPKLGHVREWRRNKDHGLVPEKELTLSPNPPP